MQISNKKSVIYLKSFFKQIGLKHIVLCPGSRNLPLIISFTSDSYFECFQILDERVAGFFALGIAKSNQSPVAVMTTSGSAAINLAPAIAEAYYQHLPIVAVTADRPADWIEKGENQTIIQQGLFRNFISSEFHIDENISFQGFEKVAKSIFPFLYYLSSKGPIHLNLSFSEPLSEIENIIGDFQFQLPLSEPKKTISSSINQRINNSQNVIIYLSTHSRNNKLNQILTDGIEKKNWIVIAESTSNFTHPKLISNIDLILKMKDEISHPDVLITIGEAMVSKSFRQWIKSLKPLLHIDISPKARNWNSLSIDFQYYKDNPSQVLNSLLNSKHHNSSEFSNKWLTIEAKAIEYRDKYFQTTEYKEFSLINFMLKNFESNSAIYWGNSSIIRYAQWSVWNTRADIQHYANRGVSGIEGVLASAIGYQTIAKHNDFYCIIGDLGFLYETNSLQAIRYVENFKIIIINNHGGKIFKNIHKLDYIKTQNALISPQEYDLIKISELNDIQHFKSHDIDSFFSIFKELKSIPGKIIFEIDLGEDSHTQWNDFFEKAMNY